MRCCARARRLIPLDEERKERLFSQLSGVTRAIVIGTTVTAMLQGMLVGIGFAIVGLPSPVVFGVLAALLSMLPVGGSALVWVPAAIWLFVDGRWGFGIFMLVWGLLLERLGQRAAALAHFRAAREFPRWRYSSACWAEFRHSAPIGIIAGPVVLSLVLALDRICRGKPPANLLNATGRQTCYGRRRLQYNPRPYGRISSS